MLSSADYAALASLIALLITILGWFFTYKKQVRLENLKGDILKIVSEHDTRFEYLHNRRGEVIDELYKLIDRTMCLMQSPKYLIEPPGTPSLKDQREKLALVISQLIDYYHQNRLYLEQDLCKQMEALLPSLDDVRHKISTAADIAPLSSAGDLRMAEEQRKLIDMAEKIVNKDIPPIRYYLEKRMRIVLGVESETKK